MPEAIAQRNASRSRPPGPSDHGGPRRQGGGPGQEHGAAGGAPAAETEPSTVARLLSSAAHGTERLGGYDPSDGGAARQLLALSRADGATLVLDCRVGSLADAGSSRASPPRSQGRTRRSSASCIWRTRPAVSAGHSLSRTSSPPPWCPPPGASPAGHASWNTESAAIGYAPFQARAGSPSCDGQARGASRPPACSPR